MDVHLWSRFVSFLLSTTTLVTVVIVVGAAWLLRQRLRAKDYPPGPKGWPFLGVVPAFSSGRNPLKVVTSFADQYGDVMSFSVGPMVIVVISERDMIREAFQNGDFNHRPRSLIIEENMGFHNNGVIMAHGPSWKEHRQFVHNVFRQLGVGKRSYEDTVAEEVRRLIVEVGDTRRQPFDPNHFFGNAIFNIICSLTLGTQYNYSDPEFQTIYDVICTNFELSMTGGLVWFLPIPYLSKVPFGRFRTMSDNMLTYNEFLHKKLKEHKIDYDPANIRDFIDIYLKKVSEVKGDESFLSDINLVACISDLIFAGTETTTSTLKWSLIYMATNPDVQKRVQAELDEVVGRERMPRLADRQHLRFTEATFLECLRMSNVVPLGVPHVAARDISFHGYTIPKGATVVPNLHKVLNDPSIWTEPDKFNPQRFLSDDGKVIRRDEVVPFGSGRRSCLGEQLARLEFFLFLTGLLHRFTFSWPDGAPSISFEGVLGITRNTGPFKICAVKRN